MPYFISGLLVGLVALIWSSDKFTDGCAALATRLNVSRLFIGIFIIGLGTSAPEMLVSATAAYSGNNSIGIGNAIGSNITNIALVLAITAILSKLPVNTRLLKWDIPLIMGAGLLSLLLMWDRHLGRFDGAVLLITLFCVMVFLFFSSRSDPTLAAAQTADVGSEATSSWINTLFWVVFGFIVLLGSSRLLVWSASGIAETFGVSNLIIGLTIVAIGTSLPELAASISSVMKNNTEMAVGNIIGSNLFNNLAVLAMPALIAPSRIDRIILLRDLPVMLGVTALLWLLIKILTRGDSLAVTRLAGIILLICFAAYQVLLYMATQA